MVALWQHNPIEVELALRAAPADSPFPPVTDRAAWEGVRARLGAVAVAERIARAEAAAGAPIPGLPATLFLEFDRTGQRDGYQQPQSARRANLAALALAECLEDRGRFLDPILNLAWAICEESSWVMPAHQRLLSWPIELQIGPRRARDTDPLHALPDVQRPVVDLGVAGTALELAECDALVGARLDPMLGRRIRHEVDQRCLTPFLTRHDFHWLHGTEERGVNNWTAVCICGIVGAATYLETDPSRLAELIARGTRSLADYLDTFDPDGGSSEGPGYWSYGFGHYTIIAHLIEHRTGGRVRLLDGDFLRQVARYPVRTVLSPGQYANFSDCDRDVKLIAPHLAYLARRLDLPELTSLGGPPSSAHRESHLTWSLRDLFWRQDAHRGPVADATLEGATDHGTAPGLLGARPSWPHTEGAGGPRTHGSSREAASFTPARHDFFSGMHWMIARLDPANPDALVLAAKGGHNGEMHNQNDVGSFIVHWRAESLMADPGRGRYTAAYFGPERYDHLVNSSRGHSVPIVNGQIQRPGVAYAAELLAHDVSDDADTLSLEMRGAYPPEANLASLRRTITLHREPPHGAVSLEDAVRFASGPGTFESVLITFGQAELSEGVVILHGERGALGVSFDPAVIIPRFERIPDVDLAEGPTALTRVVFALLAPAQEATVRLLLEPLSLATPAARRADTRSSTG